MVMALVGSFVWPVLVGLSGLDTFFGLRLCWVGLVLVMG